MPIRMATIETSHHRTDDRARLGFDAIDDGPLRIACLREAYGMPWIDQALNRGRGRSFAFALTYRSAYWRAEPL
jgi:hypothetical protein